MPVMCLTTDGASRPDLHRRLLVTTQGRGVRWHAYLFSSLCLSARDPDLPLNGNVIGFIQDLLSAPGLGR